MMPCILPRVALISAIFSSVPSTVTAPTQPYVHQAAPTQATPANAQMPMHEYMPAPLQVPAPSSEALQPLSPRQPSPPNQERPGVDVQATLNVPYPITEKETRLGWDTLLNRCWLQCTACDRWRNVPKTVRDGVRDFPATPLP